MLSLYLKAPFGVFRTFTAGSFRPTAGFITHSAAYGLLLNVAGIEMRRYDDKEAMTLIATDLPKFRLAIGALSKPDIHSVYQQLHNYPVGSSGKAHAPLTKGNKYNIVPVRRSFLSDIEAYLCMDAHQTLEEKVREGLLGRGERSYGLPFLGDNNFLPDRLELTEKRKPAKWFVPLISKDDEDPQEGLVDGVTRLSISIDRADMSKTRSMLFAPTKAESEEIPSTAWIETGYE